LSGIERTKSPWAAPKGRELPGGAERAGRKGRKWRRAGEMAEDAGRTKRAFLFTFVGACTTLAIERRPGAGTAAG
jgi:hypothetical protein